MRKTEKRKAEDGQTRIDKNSYAPLFYFFIFDYVLYVFVADALCLSVCVFSRLDAFLIFSSLSHFHSHSVNGVRECRLTNRTIGILIEAHLKRPSLGRCFFFFTLARAKLLCQLSLSIYLPFSLILDFFSVFFSFSSTPLLGLHFGMTSSFSLSLFTHFLIRSYLFYVLFDQLGLVL